MDDTLNVDRQSSDYDLYAALMLSNLLDNEQDIKDQQIQMDRQRESNQVELEEAEDSNDVIWYKQKNQLKKQANSKLRVPADKHPQIAPTEFANFIKTHGANTLTKLNSSLRRRKSILSQSLYVKQSRIQEDEDDELELNRTLSEKKRNFLKKVMTDSVKIKGNSCYIKTRDFNVNKFLFRYACIRS